MRQIVIRKDPVPALNSRVSLMGCGSSIHISCPETADALLIACGQRAVESTLPSGERIGYYPLQYALVPKTDFWQNRAALTPIEWPN